jgi:hypothetical protein
MDTNMRYKTNLRVHIAPVGYEVDRVVIPAKEMKADKVWIMIHDKPHEDKAMTFVSKIRKQLEKQNIKVEIERHNRLDQFNIIKSTKEIFEKEASNTIYVNLASGSKIQAIALMIACMMFNHKQNVYPFYAEAQNYPGFGGKAISTGVKNITELPTYQIQTPKTELITALNIIKDNGGKITKKQLAELAQDNKIITVNARNENFTQARFASLDKNIIQPLENYWGFIKIEKIGRTRYVEITQDGLNAVEFL